MSNSSCDQLRVFSKNVPFYIKPLELTKHFQSIVRSARVQLLQDGDGFSRGIVFVYVNSKMDGETILNCSHYFRSDQDST